MQLSARDNGDADPDQAAERHRSNGSHLVGTAEQDMNAECREYQDRSHRYQHRKPSSPSQLHQQTGARDDVGETRAEVEPQDEWHCRADGLARGFTTEKRSTARDDRHHAEEQRYDACDYDRNMGSRHSRQELLPHSKHRSSDLEPARLLLGCSAIRHIIWCEIALTQINDLARG
jgi:hypothetical protein